MSDTAVIVVKCFEPRIGCPSESFSGTRQEVQYRILDDLNRAEAITAARRVPVVVTLNTDHTEDPTAYYLVWHMVGDAPVQADTFILVSDAPQPVPA